MKPIPAAELVATALRNYAKRMTDNPDSFTVNEAKNLDRALRSCPAIGDIDVVWVRWHHVGEIRGWMTDLEMRSNGRRYVYPQPMSLK